MLVFHNERQGVRSEGQPREVGPLCWEHSSRASDGVPLEPARRRLGSSSRGPGFALITSEAATIDKREVQREEGVARAGDCG
jgi:hypothetical protein